MILLKWEHIVTSAECNFEYVFYASARTISIHAALECVTICLIYIWVWVWAEHWLTYCVSCEFNSKLAMIHIPSKSEASIENVGLDATDCINVSFNLINAVEILRFLFCIPPFIKKVPTKWKRFWFFSFFFYAISDRRRDADVRQTNEPSQG